MATKERELHITYNDSLAEMKGLLSAQKRVGAQWKGEMEILTKRFQVPTSESVHFLFSFNVSRHQRVLQKSLLGLGDGGSSVH